MHRRQTVRTFTTEETIRAMTGSLLPVEQTSRPDYGVPPDCLSSNYLLDFFGPGRGTDLLNRAGLLDPDNQVPEFISKMDLWRICIDVMNQSDDEGHGLLARPLPKGSWSMVYSAVNQMDNLGEGLKRFVELVPVLQCGIETNLGYCSQYAHLSFNVTRDLASNRHLERYLDMASTVFLCALIWGAEREFFPERVTLPSTLNPDDGYLIAGLPHQGIERGKSGTKISFRLSDLDVRLGARKHQAWGTHELSVYRRILHSRSPALGPQSDGIVHEVRRLLETGIPTQNEAARELGLSISTLQRRLAMANTSFRQLSRDIRSQQLASLLITSGDLEDIASEMGFSDRRSLTRACQDWLGDTPSNYRRRYFASVSSN